MAPRPHTRLRVGWELVDGTFRFILRWHTDGSLLLPLIARRLRTASGMLFACGHGCIPACELLHACQRTACLRVCMRVCVWRVHQVRQVRRAAFALRRESATALKVHTLWCGEVRRINHRPAGVLGTVDRTSGPDKEGGSPSQREERSQAEQTRGQRYRRSKPRNSCLDLPYGRLLPHCSGSSQHIFARPA